MKRRKVPRTFAEAWELPDEFDKQGGESDAQVRNDTTPVMQSASELKVVLIRAHMEKAREEAAVANAKLVALCSKAELHAKDINVA